MMLIMDDPDIAFKSANQLVTTNADFNPPGRGQISQPLQDKSWLIPIEILVRRRSSCMHQRNNLSYLPVHILAPKLHKFVPPIEEV
jgi:hypothetical protein